MYKPSSAMVLGGLAAALLLAPGCVGKKAFKENVEATDTRVTSVESAIETNQRKINDLKQETDQKIGELETDTSQALATGKEAASKAEKAEKAAKGKLIWTITLSDDKVKFDFGKAALSDGAMEELKGLVSKLKSFGKALYVELEGHTDSVGTEQRNLALGEMRAQAVRDYLNEQGIPLHALNTISFGEAKPVADNTTKDGRAHNRRVVIKVLE